MIRILCFLFLQSVFLNAYPQDSGKLPSSLTSSRSVVLFSTPPANQGDPQVRSAWKNLAEKTHSAFKKIGIDGIYYLHQEDFFAGPEITKKMITLFTGRQVRNFIFITESGTRYHEIYEIKIVEFENSMVIKDFPGYTISGADFDKQLVRLGRAVLREQLVRANFLIADRPEYLDDLKVYNGTRYENYPGRLKGLKVAVARFEEIPENAQWDDQTKAAIQAENLRIRGQNQKLEVILSKYPYPYELVNYSSDADLYKLGFQYALVPICSTGKTIRQFLDYRLKAGETNYISAVSEESGLKLETFSAEMQVCKYYIKQTIAGDIHVGARWDADTEWSSALENFIQNLTSELK